MNRIKSVKYSEFKGVDLTSPAALVSKMRSPGAPNMMPDLSGKPVKRPGYAQKDDFGEKINGVFPFTNGGAHTVIHAGEKLWLDDSDHLVFSGMNNERSTARQLGNRLFILDGEKLRTLSIENGTAAVESAEDLAYIPTVTLGRAPEGGGTVFEPFNLIGKQFRECFSGVHGSLVYQLSYGDLIENSVSVRVLDGTSTQYGRIWNDLVPGQDFTVDEEMGTVTFTTAPGVSPITGEDNIEITAGVEIEGYADRINRCSTMELFGVGGAKDRLFVTGNPEAPGRDYHSDYGNPFYFGENMYSEPSFGRTVLMGYSRLGDMLALHGRGKENESEIYLISGETENGEAIFPIKNVLTGPGAISKKGFGILGEEPLFLTEKGVYALTSKDTTGDRYAQKRSWFIDGALMSCPDLADAYFCPWKNFMLILAGDRIYLLDGAQKTYEPSAPYSTYQYECYYWEDIPAEIIWTEGDKLCFGDSGGKTYEFHKEGDSDALTYTDCGKAISAHWDLPEFGGENFYDKKSLRGVYVRLDPLPQTSVKVKIHRGGSWTDLWEESTNFLYFRWSKIRWSKFTWLCDDSAHSYGLRTLLPFTDKIIVRLENSVPGEPFGIFDASIEFGVGGKMAK